MTQQTIVQLIDDLDGGEAEETLTFGLDGTLYEIDLSADNAKGLRESLSHYVDGGRRLAMSRSARASTTSRARPASGSSGEPDAKDVRSWAISQGYEVSARGRVSAELKAAYRAAH